MTAPLFRQLIADDMHAVDQVIRRSLHSDVVLIRQVAEYIIGAGGKRLRPTLVLLAARALGMHTCPQAAWNMFQSIVLPHIGAGEDEMLVGSIALGYADEAHIVNTFRTTRESLADTVHWCE